MNINFRPTTFWLVVLVIPLWATKCPPSKKWLAMRQKIEFDLSTIDERGLRNGEVALDYEYCIPATDAAEAKVRKIDPDIRIMKGSRGRIGCTPTQWLCISSTNHPDWVGRLEGIASLPFVERIVETHYE